MPSLLECTSFALIVLSHINIDVVLLLMAHVAVFTASTTACRERRRKRNHTKKRRVVPVQVKSTADLYDAGQDAKVRNQSQEPMFPKLMLQKQSITNANYRSAKLRLGYQPHDPNEFNIAFNPSPKSENLSVKFAKECLVYVVYENDYARGKPEKEENTLDPQLVNESSGDSPDSDNVKVGTP